MLKRLILILTSLALVASACGSDGGDTASTTTAPAKQSVLTTTTAAPAAPSGLGDGSLGTVEVGAGEAIQIRSLNAISGDVAFLGIPNENGIRMAVEDYGQIHGHDVEVGTGLDDLCSADGGQAAAQTIVADEDVIGVIGTSCSGAATAASPLISAAGMVMVSGSNTSPSLTSDLAGTAGPNYHVGYYRTAHNDLYQGQAAANFALEVLGVSSAAAIHDGDPYTEGLARAFADAFEAGGGTLTGFTAVNKGDTDMVPVLTEIAAGSPDLLFFPIFQPEGDFIIQQSATVSGLGDTIMMAADGLLNSNYLAVSETEGMYFSGPDVRYGANFNESTGATAADVLADYEAEFGEAPAAPFWAHSYDAAVLLMDAISAASYDDGGTLVIDRAGVREALNGVSNYSGLIGSMSCDAFGDCSSAKITVIQNTDIADYAASTANVVYEYAPLGGAQVGEVAAGAPAGEDSTDPIRMPIHNWSSQIAGAYIMAAILESAGATTELIPSDSTLVYTAMCEGDMELVHEVWESSFGPAFEERVAEGCVIDAVTHDTKTREEWWYPAHTADHCPGLPDWEALNACAALFATPESGDKGSYLAGPVDWMKADQERVDGLNLDFVVNNAGTAGALWAALDASIANDEPIVMFNWTPNFTEVLYEGAFVEFPAFEPECNTDPSWGVNPDALYDCGNPAGAYLKIGVNSEFPAKWPNAYGVVQNINFQNSDLAEMALYVDLDGMEPEDAANAWLADHCDRWTGWSGADASACPAGPTVEPLGSDLAMCRANWASGYVQAEIVRQVLQSAGYGVSDPSAMELGPATAYMTMASGECDFWANSWYPNHYSWYENELPDGSLVSEHVEAVDGLFQDSGVQGWLITKSWADAEGIVSMDQINDTPALYEALDTDGDGVGEILGCPEDWTCDDTQEQMIAFAGWDNLVQTKAGYDALFAEFVNRVRAGDPGVMYTWTPSSYVVEMVPGVDVYWLSIEEDSVLDDSNPLGMSGGESQSQGDGFRDAPADTCTQPCQLGWEAADIQVSARSDVLAGDPYLHNLLVQIRPSILDISILQVEQTNGDGSEAHVQELAAGWMADNADIVAGWREAASAG